MPHAERLKTSSMRWMAAALAAFTKGPEHYDFAVHHAGISAEHLLKAYLASLHPALIVEAKDFNSLLYATGQAAHASVPPSQMKTIGLVEAHARVLKILRKQMPIDQRALMPLANARNGVAHNGLHAVAEVQTVFSTCLRLVDPLLTELKVDPAIYWGPYRPLHDRLIAERAAAALIRLESKLARARADFIQRYGHLDKETRAAVLATVTPSSPGYIEHDEPATCPACDSQGWLGGATHVDEDKWAVIFTPYVFTCPVCELRIENEEFEYLDDLGDEVALAEAPEDFYVNWEPDEDLFRGR